MRSAKQGGGDIGARSGRVKTAEVLELTAWSRRRCLGANGAGCYLGGMKIVVADLPSSKHSKSAPEPPYRYVRGADGRREKRYILDTASADFSEQFLVVFKRNVARARREQGRTGRAVAAE